jgi:hypothetical protein
MSGFPKPQLAESRVRRAVSFMLVALPLEHSLDGEGKPLFAVKGGVSMELRLGLRARTTKDLDAVFRGAFKGWLAALGQGSVRGGPGRGRLCSRGRAPLPDRTKDSRLHLLLARDLLAPEDLQRVREACTAIFDNRQKQTWPPQLTV